jgi:dipeptidase
MEETYGTINEHQVGIGESTCSGVFSAKALGHGGQALFSVDTLTQLAMERTNSSRAAVELMGRMAEAHGFYGQDDSFEGGAESLLVTDPHEGWIFHILSDPTKKSAIWAAQRVPDDHIGVVANAFVIRDLDPNDKTNFLFSQSVYDVAQAQGWWRPDHGLLDFAGIYSDGEYAHKFYSGRRVWGVYHLLAPSLRLSPDYEEYLKSRPYPVTAKPDKKVSVADLADVHRSYYEGTQFDQTVSIAAGPFGTPDHVASGPASGSNVTGNWERTIGLWRTSDTTIVQSR